MNTLLLLSEEQILPESRIFTEELLSMSLVDLKAVVSSLQPKAAKIFLNILSHNWTSLQISEDYLSTVVSTLLTAQVPSDPHLFYDVIPFLRYLEPEEFISLLPVLQDDKEALQVLGGYAGLLSEDQRFALGFWLRRSFILTNISQFDDLYIQKIGNLLPLISLDLFKQLKAQQVVNILPVLPKDLSPPYQRIVASRVLQVPNITAQHIEMMGRSVCQADIQDLNRFLQNTDIYLTLKRILFQCISNEVLQPDTQMLSFLTGGLNLQDPKALSWQAISNLSTVMPALSYSFLQALSTNQLLPALPDVGLARLTPAQARVLVQNIPNIGNILGSADIGSLVLGISPTSIKQLSANQLAQLLPALTNHSSSLSYAQTLAAIKTLWVSWNVTYKLQDLGPILQSLPLVHFRTRSTEILSNLNSVAGVKWNQQQALFLFQKAAQTIQGGVRSSAKSVTINNCDLLESFLQNGTTQAKPPLYDIINSLPHQLIHSALDKITSLPRPLPLLNYLSSQNLHEIPPNLVSFLPVKTCRSILKALKSEAQFVAKLPPQRCFALLDALIECLSSSGTMSTLQKLVVLRVLTPLLSGSSYTLLTRGTLKKSVERVTSYCYPEETRLLLAKLLQETQAFGNSTQWTSSVMERLDRLVPLLPVSTLQAVSPTALSHQWLMQVLSEERKWRQSPLGAACRELLSAAQSVDSMQRQRTLLNNSNMSRSQVKSSASAPDCAILRAGIVSAWSVNMLLGMTQTDFMDCLEVIGQDTDIPANELALLLGKVLQIAAPPSSLPVLTLTQLGRLAAQFSEQQLRGISLGDWQVMEAFGRQQQWTMNQLKILASGYLNSVNLTVQSLDSLHLATLGYVLCGFTEGELGQIKATEFCSAVMYLGQLALGCTEQQLYVLTRLCTSSTMFGPVSGWTQDIFLEIGSVAAGLDDMELSSLVSEQIQGLTPLAISLLQPKKLAVSFSAQQLQMFSWAQANAVTGQQRNLLDKDQLTALTLILTEDGGRNQTYRGKSHGQQCSLCSLLHLSSLIPVLHIYYLLRPVTVPGQRRPKESSTLLFIQ